MTRPSPSPVTLTPSSRKCDHCGGPLPQGARSDARSCSARCRKALSRADEGYVVTDADREAIRRAAELHPIPEEGLRRVVVRT